MVAAKRFTSICFRWYGCRRNLFIPQWWLKRFWQTFGWNRV